MDASRGSAEPRARLWSDFSFVASSRYRESVMLSLAPRPQLPKQLSNETGLRLVHVSRALRELRDRGLVECLTPDTKARGRLYGITENGSVLVAYFRSATHRYKPFEKGGPAPGLVPKIRGSFAVRCLVQLRTTQGEEHTRAALAGWSVNSDLITEDTWLSVDTYDEFLELVEAAFGDGTYEFIRELSRQAIPTMTTVMEQIMKAVSLESLAERAPLVYGKEWNYGRLDVATGKGWASFSHYDWLPTPPMCAMFQGVYEGVLHGRGAKGTVTKTRCVRSGDDRCEYLVQWRP